MFCSETSKKKKLSLPLTRCLLRWLPTGRYDAPLKKCVWNTSIDISMPESSSTLFSHLAIATDVTCWDVLKESKV